MIFDWLLWSWWYTRLQIDLQWSWKHCFGLKEEWMSHLRKIYFEQAVFFQSLSLKMFDLIKKKSAKICPSGASKRLFIYGSNVCAGGRKLTLNLRKQTALISLNNGADAHRPASAQPSSASQGADKSLQLPPPWHPHDDQQQKNICELCSPSEALLTYAAHSHLPLSGGGSFFFFLFFQEQISGCSEMLPLLPLLLLLKMKETMDYREKPRDGERQRPNHFTTPNTSYKKVLYLLFQ